MARYAALIDGKAGAYGLTFPDLPGCTAMGATIDAVFAHAAEALRDWVEVTATAGEAIPAPRPLEALRRDPEIRAALAGGAVLAAVPLVRETGKPAKANLSIDAGILSAIDDEAKRQGLTRSAFVELIAKRAIPEMV
jgi:predicted RNase H-like HicB family nuclease